jgi:hypothetical protein
VRIPFCLKAVPSLSRADTTVEPGLPGTIISREDTCRHDDAEMLLMAARVRDAER